LAGDIHTEFGLDERADLVLKKEN